MNFINTGQSKHIELIEEWLGHKPGFKTYLPIEKANDLIFRKVAKEIKNLEEPSKKQIDEESVSDKMIKSSPKNKMIGSSPKTKSKTKNKK